MPQTVPLGANLGRPFPGVGYRVLAINGTIAIPHTTTNVVHLGDGSYTVTGGNAVPDAGGVVIWGTTPTECLASATIEPSVLSEDTLKAIRALVDGRFKVDYTTSTATQYNADGSIRTVFNLKESDGITPAISPQTAVERIPQ